jgi:hypothetical protein
MPVEPKDEPEVKAAKGRRGSGQYVSIQTPRFQIARLILMSLRSRRIIAGRSGSARKCVMGKPRRTFLRRYKFRLFDCQTKGLCESSAIESER